MERVVGLVSQHPEQASHLGQRAASGSLDRLQHLAGAVVRAFERAAFRTGLNHHDRDVMCDRVVQLARNPGPLLHHRLARGHVAFALCQLRAALTVPHYAPHQEHRRRDHNRERHAIGKAAGQSSRGQVADADKGHGDGERPGRRPNREPIDRTAPRNRVRDHLHPTPNRELRRHQRLCQEAGLGGIRPPERHGQIHRNRSHGHCDRSMGNRISEPDLQLAKGEQHQCEPAVERLRGGLEGGHPRKRSMLHDISLEASGSRVIGRLDDPDAAQDQPIGAPKDPPFGRRHRAPGLLAW